MEGLIVDELKIYRGADYFIKDGITIKQPTLGEICDFGEQEYYSMVHTLVTIPNDMKWQLDDFGEDYTKISEYQLFYRFISHQLTPDKTSIIFGDLDFSAMKPFLKEDGESVVLYDPEKDIGLDEYTYMLITDIIRKIHKLKKDMKMPGNETTRQFLIEEAREEAMALKMKGIEWHSGLLNLISAMVNSEGFKFSHKDVWDMKINAFMDSVSRISKIKDAQLLLQSGYSGFGVDLKKINKDQLNWLGELK